MWNLEFSFKNQPGAIDKAQIAHQKLTSRDDLGFFKTDYFEAAIKDCLSQSDFFRNKKKLAVVGLGGSSLGTKALCQAFLPDLWQERIYFLDNIDSFTVDQWLAQIDSPQEWGWILCSKSGGTIEVTTLYDYCYQAIKEKHQFEIDKNTCVVTEDKPSLLYDFAKNRKCPMLHLPQNIGGRFSVFTPIGLLVLHFLDFDMTKALHGFNQVVADKEQVCQLASQLYASQQRQEYNLYSFQYSDRLIQWSLWLQQLWSESLGKAVDRNGQVAPINPTFIAGRGASDQHSTLQQIIEGPEKKLVLFHRVASSEKGLWSIKTSQFEQSLMDQRPLGRLLQVEAEATQSAIEGAGHHTLVLKTDDLHEESLAYLMGLWMMTIGVLGEMHDIDAFDQPGVESGKVIARRVLSQSD